jgi:hypothetical protein
MQQREFGTKTGHFALTTVQDWRLPKANVTAFSVVTFCNALIYKERCSQSPSYPVAGRGGGVCFLFFALIFQLVSGWAQGVDGLRRSEIRLQDVFCCMHVYIVRALRVIQRK